MKGPINNLAKLKEVLQGIPAPRSGYKRVFRGQSNNYPKMLTNTCRPNATTKGLLWKLALNSVPEIYELYKNSTDSGIDTIMNFSVWFEAFIQQYGPGSPYLDVTSSMEVALWFALNEVEITDQEFWISQTGHPKMPIRFPTMSFNPKAHGSVWFYVLDVPIWTSHHPPKHGELVDLLEGPELVSWSTRIQRQQGQLIYGDIKTNGGDLASFYACDPIEISSSITGSEIIDEAFTYFFPKPEDDIWFGTLSKAPLVPYLDQNSGFSYKQSLEVYIVTDAAELQQDLSPFHLQIEKLSIPIRVALRTYPELLKKISATSTITPEDATYIQINIPLFKALHPIEMWNQCALRYGLAKHARPKLLNDTRKLPLTTLENVILEFSPLDTAFNSDDAHGPVSAIWLTIENETYHCTYFFKQDDDDFRFKPYVLDFTYTIENGQFEIKADKNIPLITNGVFKTMIKYFYISLYVLRELSPELKPDPICSIIIDKTGMLPIRGETLTLVRSKKDPMDMRMHFLVDSKSEKPYSGPTLEHGATTMLYIEPANKFPSLKSIREIYGHTVEMSNTPSELPTRSTRGFDAEIADHVSHMISQLQQVPF